MGAPGRPLQSSPANPALLCLDAGAAFSLSLNSEAFLRVSRQEVCSAALLKADMAAHKNHRQEGEISTVGALWTCHQASLENRFGVVVLIELGCGH